LKLHANILHAFAAGNDCGQNEFIVPARLTNAIDGCWCGTLASINAL